MAVDNENSRCIFLASTAIARLNWRMAKKTGMSDSSLWVTVVILVVLAVWMYFRK